MRIKYRFGEYMSVTSFVWGLYLLFLIPFQLLIIGMPWEMFTRWLTLGTMIEFVIAYPIAKTLVWGVPKITLYWKEKSDRCDIED